MKKVLIPIDWSDNAEKAFEWFVRNLYQPGWEVILFHFLEASDAEEMEKKRVQMIDLQDMYESRLVHMQIPFHWVTKPGRTAGETIVAQAVAEDANMIVMGARGLGKIKKAIMGSVSDYVLRKAYIPVLICKLPSDD